MPNETSQVMTPEAMAPARTLIDELMGELNRILLGRDALHQLVLAGLLSRGHILLEGLPGTGKTQLIKSLGALLNLKFSRVQFTPDLMPADILGSHILQQTESGEREMVFKQGPAFTQILLADEINRASPKTQSALLEAMQERSVTLLGHTRPLPDPFFVLASQNPIELEGTYPLPEAQLDRFLFKLTLPPSEPDVLEQIISERRHGRPPQPKIKLDAAQLNMLFQAQERVLLPRAVANYIARLVAATQGQGIPDSLRDCIAYGASPRAAIAMAESSRALALLDGRPSVGFRDVDRVVVPVLNHRIIPGYKARLEGVDGIGLARQIKDAVPEVAVDLPANMSVEVETP